MPISDTKKVQTIINVTAEQIQIIRSAIDTMKATRTLFSTASPNIQGTCLSGSLVSLNGALNSLDTIVNSGSNGNVWDGLVNCYVSTHRKEAL